MIIDISAIHSGLNYFNNAAFIDEVDRNGELIIVTPVDSIWVELSQLLRYCDIQCKVDCTVCISDHCACKPNHIA